ncbi:3-hydroxyacyl-ACP dehydratase FabZ [Skermanella sp. TT6]|uniref:3-hydroxyacyl-[acyl-carrier-protein] dehydratase FabZ n=1 Tax=Skermanella cutis TaxID=2775420 RepID=A0ABX7BES9_9PROT|nr:3-hydroxyacyl-ACP dehydratase FabZ [Skermanella sp. TT6]QQP92100.1 3-hydroxyacyl-ACP dehydratase FabZ [Skermanella sp. TT6]
MEVTSANQATDHPDSEEQSGIDIDVLRVMEMIPHRYPMLMIDRVTNVVANVSAVGVKNVTINEHFFQGHFPQRPVMPGVLIVEAMAQTAGVLVVHTLGADAEGKLVYFMSIDDARFRKPVTPGDTVYIHVTKLQHRRNVWKFKGEAKVNGVLCSEATFAAMILDE